MRSRLAEELKRQQRERFARMRPAERVALTERLGVEGLAEFMSAQRRGRRRSRGLESHQERIVSRQVNTASY